MVIGVTLSSSDAINSLTHMKKLSEIGNTLVKHAHSKPLPEISQTTELLPYILVASETMSVREISSFLLKSAGIKISATTVSRALNNKDEHLHKFAEYLSITGGYMARTYDTSMKHLFQLEEEYSEYGEGSPMNQLLGYASEQGMNAQTAEHEDYYRIKQDTETICRMIELWDNIPSQVKPQIQFLIFKGEDEQNECE